MKKKKNLFFSTDKNAFIFVIEEIVLLLLIILQLFYFLGIKEVNNSLTFFNNVILIQNILWFVASILIFVVMYFAIVLRDARVIAVHKEFLKLVWGTAKQKVFGMDREVLTLIAFEFVFAIILAFSIGFYLDPELTFPGLSKVPFPFNFIAFVAFVGFGLYVFSQTRAFRKIAYSDPIIKKILPAERLTPLLRITNKKSGTIRIKKRKHGKHHLKKFKK
jgi:hypothetical protein